MYFFSQPTDESSLPTTAWSLAWEQAVVDELDDHLERAPEELVEVFRLWQIHEPTVVMGRGSKIDEEVSVDNCVRDNVGVFRRSSGGCSIVAGPGCLMYSVVLPYANLPSLRMLDVAHRFVMTRIQTGVNATLSELGVDRQVLLKGTCDLVLDDRKISGNALRCKRNCFIYHGTILLAMSLDWITRYLLEPKRRPDYRGTRLHSDFVTNLMGPGDHRTVSDWTQCLSRNLVETWNANLDWDDCSIASRVAERTDEIAARMRQA
jgi:lipoate---protein ligase